MEAAIIHTLRYFARFAYAPTLDELHIFLSVKISGDQLKKILNQVRSVIHSGAYGNLSKNRNSRFQFFLSRRIRPAGRGNEDLQVSRYALRERAGDLENTVRKVVLSETKIREIRIYICILAWFPQIRLVGLSGSVAMHNAEESDDIDLFVITARRRMWTARLICYLTSQLLGIRRRRTASEVQDTVCHNLFFDESSLALPYRKRTEYGAHEVLQMKPLISKGGVYEAFLKANEWIYQLFPNARSVSHPPESAGDETKYLRGSLDSGEDYRWGRDFALFKMMGNIFDLAECAFGRIQLAFINKHKTTELITDTQLWFFPDDFEAKLG